MSLSKIKTTKELETILNIYRKEGRKIVLCHGCFDLLHIGHIRYLRQASQMGDILVVTITPNQFVDKGPHRPAFNEQLRAEAVASLDCVDHVAINSWPTAEETLRQLRPHVYVKGSEFENVQSDMTGKMAGEAKVVKEIGAKLAFTHDIVFSSSNLINRNLSTFSEEVNDYLNFFRKRYRLQHLLDVIDNMRDLNVLVIGDTILDEYQYCNGIGKSSKDPVLALQYQSHELFAGGVLAVANHVANFSDNVHLVSILGENDNYENFIRDNLNKNINPKFFFKKNAPTIIKRRFIEGYSRNKLFEIYVMDDSELDPHTDQMLDDWIATKLPNYDLVMIADFGHGAISGRIANTVSQTPTFLAVNTQANAGNRGFNTISKYSRIDCACLAEHEIRLEMRDMRHDAKSLMEKLSSRSQYKYLTVTRGSKGCIVRNGGGYYVEIPAFARNVIDRIGAGDAFFAVTSLAAVQAVSNEIIGFIGNIVGALAVEIMGNKKPVDKMSVKKFITSLMK